jgi:Tfp pilus assembly protein PilN
MIEFNLLPDVKLEYLQARYKKRLIVTISVIVTAFFLAVFIALFAYVRIVQPRHIQALDRDIDQAVETLNAVPDLENILTVQNQLNSLPALHDEKKISSRLFDYLNKVTPTQATISETTLDLDANTLIIKGNADQLSTVNKFADTLKFTEYKIDGDQAQEGRAFTDVVLASFAVAEQTEDVDANKRVTYELQFNFDPVIFANVSKGDANATVELEVPKIISTRSETQKPDSLFEEQPSPSGEGAQ